MYSGMVYCGMQAKSICICICSGIKVGLLYNNAGYIIAKQKHLGCKKGEANQKQQLSDYKSIHSYTCD